jgi:hypothetical protein
MKAFLIIVFLINGQPFVNLKGFGPMETTLENCDSDIESALSYLNSEPAFEEGYGVYCNTVEELRKEFNIIFNSKPT